MTLKKTFYRAFFGFVSIFNQAPAPQLKPPSVPSAQPLNFDISTSVTAWQRNTGPSDPGPLPFLHPFSSLPSFLDYTGFEMHVRFSDLKSPGRISWLNVTMGEGTR
jgi:hypothetical protein